MLKSLFIQNFVLIDNLDIRFDKGSFIDTVRPEQKIYYIRSPLCHCGAGTTCGWQEYKERFG